MARVSSSQLNSLHRASFPAVDASRRIIVSAGQNVTIACSVQAGNPVPKIQWFKEGVSITVDRSKYFAEGDALSIQTVSKEDAASYHCIAENLAGKNMATVQLIIGGKQPRNIAK